jgi:hypothetical protein
MSVMARKLQECATETECKNVRLYIFSRLCSVQDFCVTKMLFISATV